MQSESVAVAATDTRGKHRISAELKRLEQETSGLRIVCDSEVALYLIAAAVASDNHIVMGLIG
ncbi:hypothetical protein Acr_24g0003570 [Actinidia rufa]|uniref:Uncharacterized protein n=1 Tax=Actinidia rufa TaxID=165716 RepID=A0A7J0GTJ5_9ERIC|nr:hypothetical protein Acr_24g0003570 [Actinidia rufa]